MLKTFIDLMLILSIVATLGAGALLLHARSPLCVVALLASALLVWLRQLWARYEEEP